MKITKIGHCCLLIEIEGKRILTDPGKLTTAQNTLSNIDLILITHEHSDHLHTESLVEILRLNPEAKVVTNSSVGKVLSELNMTHTILEGNDEEVVLGILLEAFDGPHAEIYENFGQVQNTGYFIAEKLFYPGDSYIKPGKNVPVLALPVSGPWCKSSDAITYALQVKPEKAFPVHDGLLNENGIMVTHGVFEKNLADNGIEFVRMVEGETKGF
ncbi:MAG: MBL fold metallo-hydrolase [Candidatus Paceibacterota bacterium]